MRGYNKKNMTSCYIATHTFILVWMGFAAYLYCTNQSNIQNIDVYVQLETQFLTGEWK